MSRCRLRLGLASANDPSRSKGTVFERAEPPAEEKQAPWSSAPVGLKCSEIDSMALAVLTAAAHSQGIIAPSPRIAADRLRAPLVSCHEPQTTARWERKSTCPYRECLNQWHPCLAGQGRESRPASKGSLDPACLLERPDERPDEAGVPAAQVPVHGASTCGSGSVICWRR